MVRSSRSPAQHRGRSATWPVRTLQRGARTRDDRSRLHLRHRHREIAGLLSCGTGAGSSIWLRQRTLGETGLYLGIVCESNEAVDAAYTAAISSGGIDQGKPADRTYFAHGYYAANVADFDGNRLEFVHKAWNPPR